MGRAERAAAVDVSPTVKFIAGPDFAYGKRSVSMHIGSGLYRKLKALSAWGRPCLIYTDEGICRASRIEDLQSQEGQGAVVKVRGENGSVQHIALPEIEAVVEQGGHVA